MTILKIHISNQLLAESEEKPISPNGSNASNADYKEISLIYQDSNYHLCISDKFKPVTETVSLFFGTTQLEFAIEEDTERYDSQQPENFAYDFLTDSEFTEFIASAPAPSIDLFNSATTTANLYGNTNLLAIYDIFRLPSVDNNLKPSQLFCSSSKKSTDIQGNILRELGMMNDTFHADLY